MLGRMLELKAHLMHESKLDAAATATLPKAELYAQLHEELRGLLAGETDFIANLANSAALIFHALPALNWAGFYLLKPGEGELVVGPFQGRPACVRIALGKGVCGTAAARRESIIVRDVNQFTGHIACDSASNSEIVVPLLRGDQLLGVLDLDSPRPGRFDEEDRRGLEGVVEIVMRAIGSEG